jgi:hypothetical protein
MFELTNSIHALTELLLPVCSKAELEIRHQFLAANQQERHPWSQSDRGGIGVNRETHKGAQKLQMTLDGKVKRSPGFRFFLLYDKASRRDVLSFASAL